MNSHTLDNTMVASVVAHMNEDHGDACLAIVQAIGGFKTSCQASMLSMDASGADFLAVCEDGTEQMIRIDFDKPISRDSQVRGHLVALAKRARAIQDEKNT